MTSPVFKSPIPLNYLDTDTALTANSDVKVPTQKAVKAYADTKAPALGADDNYVTDAEKTKLANLSGVNTGDQTLPVKASGAEVDTGTDDAKFLTPKAITDSSYAKETATTGKISFVLVPPNGYTAGNGNVLYGFSYGATILHQVCNSLNMARSHGVSLPSDVDLTGNLVFKYIAEIGTSATVTPQVLVGYARNGAISAITGYNNDNLSSFTMSTTTSEYTLGTIAGSNFSAGDTIYVCMVLKSSYSIHQRSLWMEYTKKWWA